MVEKSPCRLPVALLIGYRIDVGNAECVARSQSNSETASLSICYTFPNSSDYIIVLLTLVCMCASIDAGGNWNSFNFRNRICCLQSCGRSKRVECLLCIRSSHNGKWKLIFRMSDWVKCNEKPTRAFKLRSFGWKCEIKLRERCIQDVHEIHLETCNVAKMHIRNNFMFHIFHIFGWKFTWLQLMNRLRSALRSSPDVSIYNVCSLIASGDCSLLQLRISHSTRHC